MKRLDDWRTRLRAHAAQAARKKFRPGSHDCALFAAGAVKAMTGTDLARGWRSKYRSLKRGREMLAELGYADHVALAAAHLPEIPPAMAQVGDVAAVEEEGELALGIVQGERIWVLRPDGLGTVLLTDASRAFCVCQTGACDTCPKGGART